MKTQTQHDPRPQPKVPLLATLARAQTHPGDGTRPDRKAARGALELTSPRGVAERGWVRYGLASPLALAGLVIALPLLLRSADAPRGQSSSATEALGTSRRSTSQDPPAWDRPGRGESSDSWHPSPAGGEARERIAGEHAAEREGMQRGPGSYDVLESMKYVALHTKLYGDLPPGPEEMTMPDPQEFDLIPVTDEEVRHYYEAHPNRFPAGGFDEVSHIVKDVVRFSKHLARRGVTLPPPAEEIYAEARERGVVLTPAEICEIESFAMQCQESLATGTVQDPARMRDFFLQFRDPVVDLSR